MMRLNFLRAWKPAAAGLAVFLACWAWAAADPTTQPAPQDAGKSAKLKIDRFESAILAFEKKDKANPPSPGGTLFVGSSTFALWKSLEKDFQDVRAINRGFGGSTTPEVIQYAPRIILPYKPAKIVFYCGENDVAAGAGAEEVLAGFRQFLELVHRELPQTHVYYLPMKTSQSRLKYAATFEKIRAGVRDLAAKTDCLHYVDIASPLMDGDKPRAEYYLPDKLHLNRAGYEVIIPIIREAISR